MSSKRGKQKEVVEEDFEAFVRHRLSSISDDLKEMKGTQVKIQRDIESLQGQIKKNESSISKLKESLDTKLEVLTGQLHEANTRIDQIENDITKSQIVKLQNKAVRVINDVPLMESITPHYTSLGLLKFPDIVKLNTCMLFYDYFHHEKFPNIPVSLVSELHNYSTRSASSNQVAIPLFRTNLRRFCPSTIGSFFWNVIPQSIRDKLSKKMFKKALLRWYLAQY